MSKPRTARHALDLRGQQRDADTEAQETRLKASTDSANLRWVMSDKRGRDFVASLLRRAGVEEESFTGEAESTAHREGRRSLGVELQRELKTDQFELFLQMLKEQKGV